MHRDIPHLAGTLFYLITSVDRVLTQNIGQYSRNVRPVPYSWEFAFPTPPLHP